MGGDRGGGRGGREGLRVSMRPVCQCVPRAGPTGSKVFHWRCQMPMSIPTCVNIISENRGGARPGCIKPLPSLRASLASASSPGQGGGSGSNTSDWTGGGRQKADHHCAIPVKEPSGQGARKQEETRMEKGLG